MTGWQHDHVLHLGGETQTPESPAGETLKWRKRVEPWLSAVFQSEHLSLLLGNGFTTAIAHEAAGTPVTMEMGALGCAHEDKVSAHATKMAKAMSRGTANIEYQLSAALSLATGLEILEDAQAAAWKTAIDNLLERFVANVLSTETSIAAGLSKEPKDSQPSAREILISFLMSFASRAVSRERLKLFTTNYDRLIERGCDLAGLRIIDRFVGAIEPVFRSSRLQIDMHYTPPGVRGEPRHLEGVVHLTKLHGSVDWRYEGGRLYRAPVQFGASTSGVQESPRESVIVYPNAVKDIETANYPYADLFRDFSSALCQPNSVLVTYGYGFGDDHVNNIIADMLTIPSAHLVVVAWDKQPHDRVASFVERVGRPQQLTLLLGTHFGDIRCLVEHYLPKPAIDPLTIRMTELIERRSTFAGNEPDSGGSETP